MMAPQVIFTEGFQTGKGAHEEGSGTEEAVELPGAGLAVDSPIMIVMISRMALGEVGDQEGEEVIG